MSIRHSGDYAEERFVAAVHGSWYSTDPSAGDVVMYHNGRDRHVEIKSTSGKQASQVRPIKWLPLVVLHRPTDIWHVLSAPEQVNMACYRSRGQHTELPWECCQLSLPFSVQCRDAGLPDAIARAFDEGDDDLERYEAMRVLNQRLAELRHEVKERIARRIV